MANPAPVGKSSWTLNGGAIKKAEKENVIEEKAGKQSDSQGGQSHAMYAKRLCQILLIILALTTALSAQTAKRPLKLDDLFRLREVRDPQISPDGKWVAYVVSTVDVKEDKSNAHIWMVSYDGKTDRQMTWGQESEASPGWSPDGKYLSFTSSRKGQGRGNQVWLLDRSGGEAVQLTSFGAELKGRLQSYDWSPDSKRLALVVGDPDPEAEAAAAAQESGGKPKPPKPLVTARYKYKQHAARSLLRGPP